MKLLLAEDDELLRMTLARHLADAGYPAICVPDGEHARNNWTAR